MHTLTVASTKSLSDIVLSPSCAAAGLPHEFSTSCSTGLEFYDVVWAVQATADWPTTDGLVIGISETRSEAPPYL